MNKRLKFILTLVMLLTSGMVSAQVKVGGNVYGGGEIGKVTENTSVTVNESTTVSGSVYGGGQGKADSVPAGGVKGNTLVTMTGGQVDRSIYGGGELGSVGTFTDTCTAASALHVVGEPTACQTGTGLAKVLISGGQVGINAAKMPEPESDDDFGYVFCGGRGEADSVTHPKANLLAVVDSTYLEVSGSALITASAYGGSENGMVLHNTHVKIMGGQIGTGHYRVGDEHHWDGIYGEDAWNTVIGKIKAGTFTDVDAAAFHECDHWAYESPFEVYDVYANDYSSQGGSVTATDGHTFYGNVFGGGSGYYPYAAGQWRRSAGRVGGNTKVEITGGHILTSVYGGNEQTDVLGSSTVTMTGGTIGVPRTLAQIAAHPVTCYLFGGGKGDQRVLFNTWNNVESAVVNVSGGTIFGSVFGGGEDGHVHNDVTVNIKPGAFIGTWGTSYVDGNVFGAGRGFSGDALTAGTVGGNVAINITGGTMLGSVYGGGRLASVGTLFMDPDDSGYGHMQNGDSHGNVVINISGGTIGNSREYVSNPSAEVKSGTMPYTEFDDDNRLTHTKGGNVFAASMGRLTLLDGSENPLWPRIAKVKNTTLTISDSAVIKSNVYGGGEYGFVMGETRVNVNGGTIGTSIGTGDNQYYFGSVYGAGYGTTNHDFHNNDSSAYADILAGRVYGNAYVTLLGGTVRHDVYGGGEMASVGLKDVVKNGNTYVNIGNASQASHADQGPVIMGEVYGANNINGTPFGSTHVNVYSTKHTDADSYPSPSPADAAALATNALTQQYALRSVYGGGNLAAHTPSDTTEGGTHVHIYYCKENTVRNVFGGGNAAATRNNNVVIDGGRIHRLFGGGNGEGGEANVQGNATTSVHGGLIDTVFGGSNVRGTVSGSIALSIDDKNTADCDHIIGTLFGGGNEAPGGGGTLTIACSDYSFSEVYGGSHLADISGDVNLNILGGTYGTVYAGSKGREDRSADIDGNVTLNLHGGTIVNAFGGSNLNGNITGIITVNVEDTSSHCALELTNLYGASNLAQYTPNKVEGQNPVSPVVNVKHIRDGNSITGYVFGGGKGMESSFTNGNCNRDNYDKGRVTANPQVNIGDDNADHYVKIDHNVYGGGELAEVIGSTEVNMQNAHSHIVGNLFGAGRGYVGDSIAANVLINSSVNITGGKVSSNVYGGGELASVGTFTGMAGHNNIAEGTGLSTVTITGGHIGADDLDHATSDTANGNVYGAGLGRAGSAEAHGGNFHFAYYNYVKNTDVTIGGDAIVRGSVFGGGEDGHVWNDTRVKIKGGEIGTDLTAAEESESSEGVGINIYTGNVYGGGRGINESDLSSHTHSLTAGRVFGNTYVEVTGGIINHDVFGGGSLSSVGDTIHDVEGDVAHDIMGNEIAGSYSFDTLGGTLTRAYQKGDPVTGTGLAHVRIVGGRIGITGHNEGSVFGSGRGLAGDAAHSEYYHMAYVHNSVVYIGDTTIAAEGNRQDVADVRGAVFGGGANGHVTQNTYVKVANGIIGGKTADTYTLMGLTIPATADTTVAIKGTDYYSGLSESDTLTDRWGRVASGRPTFLGNVYAGGRGVDHNASDQLSRFAGRVFGNATVEITGGVIYHNVYGGGSMATVGHYTNGEGLSMLADPGTGKAIVKVAAGRIGTNGRNNGRVYGAGRGLSGSAYAHMSYVNSAFVTIGDTSAAAGVQPYIRGSVFGSGANGHVQDSTLVVVNRGVIGNGRRTGSSRWINEFVGNVYGGGRGVDLAMGGDTISLTAGRVYGSTHVVVNGGHIHHNVYGGGSLASVGTGAEPGYRASTGRVGRAKVDVHGGLIGLIGSETDSSQNLYGNVYGGGRGRAGVGLDYGNDYTRATYVNNTEVTVDYTEAPSATNRITGNVYGGGDNGHVNNSTSVTITRGQVGTRGDRGYGSLEGNVFGGGRGEDTYPAYLVGADGNYITKAGASSGVPYNRTDRSAVRTYYQTARTSDSLAIVDSVSVTAGLVYGNTHVTVNAANASDAVIKHHVYGGGANASVGNYWIATGQAGEENYDLGEVYLLTPGTGTCTVDILGGTLGTSGRNNGMVFGASRGDIGAPGSVYDSIAYVNNTLVTIGTSGQGTNFANPIINGSVYGGGENGHTVGDAHVTIHSGRVGNHSSMYEDVDGYYAIINNPASTPAQIAANQALADAASDFLANCGNVYGGGCGTDKYDSDDDGTLDAYNTFAGVVFGNATVTMDGGYVERHIYGGGSMANLGRRIGEIVYHTNTDTCFALSWPVEIHCRPGSGLATVNITGDARVGYNGKDNGDVFGASRGMAGDRYAMARIANVDSTSVNINITGRGGKTNGEYYSADPMTDHTTPMIAGALHGGAENGHVIRSTNLQITSGLVSHSVYGGGKGKGLYNVDLWKKGTAHTAPADSLNVPIYSITAGRTYGNTYITMTGGKVGRNIYGGGNMASVGKGSYAGGPGDPYEAGYGERWISANKAELVDTLVNSGHTYISITGGTIGAIGFKDDLPIGNVFGGCRGEAAPHSDESPRYYYSPAYFSGYVNHTHITLGDTPVATPTASSPRLYGSVYGGGQDGHVRGETHVVINDAEIGVPYNDTYTTEIGTSDLTNINWEARGNVYGAGSGIGKYDSDNDGIADSYNTASGSVTDSTYVAINGGLIHRNVYGGGSLASVGPAPSATVLTINHTRTRVDINSTVGTADNVTNDYGGYVFGSSRGEASNLTPSPFALYATCQYTMVNINNGGHVLRTVYGGGENGQVGHDTYVTLNSGATVNHSIYAGGKGSWGEEGFSNDTVSGRVKGDTRVDLLGGTVGSDLTQGCVYGGARRANIWGSTHVNIGTDAQDANDLVVNGAIFGANNLNGTPYGNTNVHVYHTGHTTDNTLTHGTTDIVSGNQYPTGLKALAEHIDTLSNVDLDILSDAEKANISAASRFAIPAVYGGGNMASHEPTAGNGTTLVHIHYCEENTVYEVFGGGNAANTQNNSIILDGGRVYRLFGGGNGAGNHTDPTASDYNPGADVSGTASTEIRGGFIDYVFGGSNQKGDIGSINLLITKDEHCDELIGNLFGGGNEADGGGGEMTIACGTGIFSEVYGGANKANITGDITLNIQGGTIGKAFGGSKGEQNGVAANIDGNITVNVTGGTLGYVYGGSNWNGNILGTIEVNIDSIQSDCPLTIANNVYGSSYITMYKPVDSIRTANTRTPVVNIKHGTVGLWGGTVDDEHGNVYGGGHGQGSRNCTNPTVYIGGIDTLYTGNDSIHNSHRPVVMGNVYGGGMSSRVFGNTLVGMFDGTVRGNIFGASKGIRRTESPTMTEITTRGIVDGWTTVNMSGGTVEGNIYGGGEMGSVYHIDRPSWSKYATDPDSLKYGTSYITVTGGTVGVVAAGQSVDMKGNVFGGGLGLAKVPADELRYRDTLGNSFSDPVTDSAYLMDMGMVSRTEVSISGSNTYIVNSVYGGGDNGRVSDSTNVTVSGGTIGKPLTPAERYVDADAQVVRVYTGNVYGGGNGATQIGIRHLPAPKDVDVPVYRETAGRVDGNTRVLVNGGTVRHNVYGGGNMASVGVFTANTAGLATYTSGGTATVTINGTALIGPKKDDLTKDAGGNALRAGQIDTNFMYLGGNEGLVFGSSRGISGGALRNMSFTNISNVIISGDAQMTNVFGGGENGHVQDSTSVRISGGVIGGIPIHGSGDYTVADGGEYDGVTLHFAPADDETTVDEFGEGHFAYRGMVFGGGKGYDFISWFLEQQSLKKFCYTAGRVYGNTSVTISDSAKIYNRVFGGGVISSVGTFTYVNPDNENNVTGVVANTGTTTITIHGGEIGTSGLNNGDVYGGGRGLPGHYTLASTPEMKQVPDEAYVGNTNVVIDGGTIHGNVYGGAASGHVQGDAHVTITDGTIGTSGLYGWHSNVYGGGGGTARYATSSGALKHSVTSGRVYGNTSVKVSGGTVIHNVYGGGAMASVGTFTYGTPGGSSSGNHIASCADGTGLAEVYITGGTIGTNGHENGMVFGSSRGEIDSLGALGDTLAWVFNTKVTIGDTTVEHNMTAPLVKGSVYGGGENGHVKDDAYVHIYSGQVGYQSDVKNGPQNVDKNDPTYEFRGNVYGAGCGTDQYFVKDTTVKRVIGGTLTTLKSKVNPANDSIEHVYAYNPYAGTVQGNTHISITGGHIFHNVYGGGAMGNVGVMESMTHNTNESDGFALSWPNKIVYADGNDKGYVHIDITGGRIGTMGSYDGDVFGGARGEAGDRYAMARYANVRSSIININIPTLATPAQAKDTFDVTPCITGSVYGGGENGHIIDSTYITLDNGYIGHALYGGGKGKGKYTTHKLRYLKADGSHAVGDDSTAAVYSLTAGKVYGNTRVVMNGGHVGRNIFGGGNQGSIGKGNYAGGLGDYNNVIGYGELVSADSAYWWSQARTSGTATVIINDGTVGEPSGDKDNLPLGNVFGGARGSAPPNIDPTLSPRILYYPTFFSGYVNRTYVTIGDGTHTPRIYGSVYGGGMDGHVRWDAHVRVVGGEIGNAYTDANKTLVGTDDLNNLEWILRGNVFGSGSGIGKYDSDGDGTDDALSYSSGSVTHFTTVDIEGGTIHRNVYGGGSLATVGPPNIPATKPDATIDQTLATVNVKGGFVGTTADVAQGYGGNVFGGSRGDTTVDNSQFSTVIYSRVNVTDGHVYASVYGGGEIGTIKQNTDVNISGGIIGDSSQYIIPDGLAHTSDSVAHYYNDNVPLRTDVGHVYGGGKGIEADTAGIYKTFCNVVNTAVAVSDNARIYGSVYGGAANGHVLDSTKVSVSGGTIGVLGLTSWDGHIFGGGEGSGTVSAEDEFTLCATCGNVSGNTHVTMTDGTLKGSVYGGGRLALTGVNADGDHTSYVTGSNYDSTSHGFATVVISGGTIGNSDGTALQASDWSLGDIFGSGRGDVDYYQSVAAGSVANTSVIVSGTPTVYGAVFGGGEMAGVGYWSEADGHPFVAQTGTSSVNVSGGTIGTSLEFTQGYLEDAGDWTIVTDGKLSHSCTGNIIGGSQGDVDTSAAAWISMGRSRQTYVAVSGGTIMGNVYGGSEQGVVTENTHVTITGGTIGTDITGVPDSVSSTGHYYFGSVFGGGYGSERCSDDWKHYNDSCTVVGNDTAFIAATMIAGRVYGNTYVDISGGTVHENVYGGGNMASVGYVERTNGAEELLDAAKRHGGLCDVRVSDSAVIGPHDGTLMNGHVYGAGKGVGNDPNGLFKRYCNVDSTLLTISGGHIDGSAFGGGADCHVLGNTHTFVTDSAYIGSNEDIEEYDGCVFGGGRNALNINHTAGRVQGHTYVTMTGGRVRRTILGGGAMARTGVDVDGLVDSFVDASGNYDSTYHGSTFVEVSGTTDTVVGGLSTADSVTYRDYLGTTYTDTATGNVVVYRTAIGAYDGAVLVDNDYTIGDIFGGGKGDTKDTADIFAGRVMNTHVKVHGSPRVMADIYAGGEMSCVGWYDTLRTNPDHDKYYANTGYTQVVVSGSPYGGTPYEFSEANIHGGRPWTLIDSLGRLYHTCSGNVYGGGQGYVEETATHRHNWVQMGRVRNTSVTVTGGRFLGNVFGGGSRGIVKEDCHVTITGGHFGTMIVDNQNTHGYTRYYYGSVFGGGYGNHKTFLHYNDSCFINGNDTLLMRPIEFAGRVYGNTYVNISGGTIKDCVFGGGDMASTGWVERDPATGRYLYNDSSKRHNGVCTINITGNTIVGPLDYQGQNAYVYGAGKGVGYDPDEITKYSCNVNETRLTINLTSTGNPSLTPDEWNPATHGGRIWGSSFGGGADAHVLGDVHTEYKGGLMGTQGTTSYDGNIFGAGRNFHNSNHTNGRVQGNVYVVMDGGTIQGTIFGGGRLALTGIDSTGHFIDSLHGNVNILVRGNAIIGNANTDSLLFADQSCGDIFGSGKGDVLDYEDIWAGRVTNATITVKDSTTGSPTIYGGVFGGGEMASIGWWDDTITSGGTIVFHTDGSGGTDYGTFYEGTGRAIVTILGGTIGSEREFTYYTKPEHEDPADRTGTENPGEWTMYEDDGILFHTATGNVYGGSQGDVDPSAPRWVSMGRSRTATVTIGTQDATAGPRIRGGVFGGSEQGIITGDTRVIVYSGTIGTSTSVGSTESYVYGDVYAAGYGSDDPADNAVPYVYTDEDGVEQTIDNPVNDSTAGSIALGVGWEPELLAGRVFGNSSVDILGGRILGSVYGGGSFASVGDDKPGYTVNGNTTVNIGSPTEGSATILGEVFGANNYSGTPFGNTEVNIYHTAHTDADRYPDTVALKALASPESQLTGADLEAQSADGTTMPQGYALAAVYGGGNKAAHEPKDTVNGTTLVHVYYCDENTIHTVYGGGNAAGTRNDSIVIDGGRIYRVFGGGNGYSETGNHTDPDAPDYNPGADVYGIAATSIHGGLINQVYGGSNQLGDIGHISLVIDHADPACPEVIDETFGGGNEAPSGPGEVTIECGTYAENFYAGANAANLGTADNPVTLTVNIKGGRIGNLFGGCKGTDSSSADIYGDVIVNFYGGNVVNLFGGSDVNGNISGTVTVNVDIDPEYGCGDGLNLDYVFGGGRAAAYTPFDPFRASPTVNIMNNRYRWGNGTTAADSAWVEITDVYGGGLGATAMATSYPRVVVGGFPDGKTFDGTDSVAYPRAARVFGNVYGGGSEAPVIGNTLVMIRDAVVGGDAPDPSLSSGIVFGGGLGATAKVQGDTYVGIFGRSDIKNNVYGGGNAGIVSGSTDLQIAYQQQVFPPEFLAFLDTSDNNKLKGSFRSTTPDVKFRYTTNGVAPTPTTGTLYTGSDDNFEFGWNDTVLAIAYLWDEVNSKVDSSMIPSSVAFDRATAPVITIKEGTGSDPDTVILTGSIGARIRYTLDGTEPTHASTLYGNMGEPNETGATDTFTITSTQVVKAMSEMRGCYNSAVSALTLEAPTVTITGTSCTITGPAGTTLVYTVNGDTPVGTMAGSTLHGTAVDGNTVTFTLTGSTDVTIKAIAQKPGHLPSNIGAAVYRP